MKKVSYIIATIVIFLVLAINGESFQFYLNNFEEQFYSTTMYLQDYQQQEDMLVDIQETAKMNNVSVFTVSNEVNSAFSSTKIFYCDEYSEKYLKENFNLQADVYKSLFSGRTEISYYSFDEIPDITLQNIFYLIGDSGDIKQFKTELIDKYAGNFPKEGNKNLDIQLTSIGIWIIAGIIILFMQMFNTNSLKKECFLRVSLGENKWKIISKLIFTDLFIYALTFILELLVLSKVTYVWFNFTNSLIGFSCILIFYLLIYAKLLHFDAKKAISNTKMSSGLLKFNYILKCISCILTTIIVSSNIVIIKNGIEFYRQRDFFENYFNYSFVDLDYKLYMDSNDMIIDRYDEGVVMREEFYREFFIEFDATLLAQVDFDDKVIICNKNAEDYLKNSIEEFATINCEKDIYFIVPEGTDDCYIDELRMWVESYEGENFVFDYDTISYKHSAKMIAIDNQSQNGSAYIKNPIVIYNNTDASVAQYAIDTEWFKCDYEKDVMYNISDATFEGFISRYNLKNQIVSRTNVFESYIYHWKIIQRSMVLSMVLAVLILILEYIIIKYIIRLEYEANAIELSLKKVLGYSVWEKNKTLLSITAITSLISIAISAIISQVIDNASLIEVIIGGVILLLFEYVIILNHIQKVEKTNVQKILKGGCL